MPAAIVQILGCATASGTLATPMRQVARRLAAGPASVTPLGHAPASALNPPRWIAIDACVSGGAAHNSLAGCSGRSGRSRATVAARRPAAVDQMAGSVTEASS